MLLLHTDVFLTTGEIVLQRAFGKLRAGPGPPQIAATVLLHRHPFNQVVFNPGGFWDKEGGGMGRRGRKEGSGKGGCRGRSTNLRLSASPASVRTSR